MAGTVIFRDNSKEVLKKSDAAAYKALVAIGETSVTAVKKICPVDTSRLKNSITYVVAGNSKVVYVGTNVEYAPAVEYGTRKDGTAKKGAHFFSNGIKAASRKNKKIVEAYLKNA